MQKDAVRLISGFRPVSGLWTNYKMFTLSVNL